MPPDLAAARRMRERYARQRQGITWEPPYRCVACDRPRTPAHDPHCSRCWEKLTPEGRQAKRERVRASRARKKQLQQIVADPGG